jgi:hypothetical protein
MKFLSAVFLFMMLAGCSMGIPEHTLIELNGLNRDSAYRQIDAYNNNVIQKTQMISSITFDFAGRSMTALGLTALDEKTDSFFVAALDPMGLTLFKLKRENGKLVSKYVLPQFGPANVDKTADMINRDIALVYFNRKINLDKKSIWFEKYRIRVFVPEGNADYEYFFGGSPLKLIKKARLENQHPIWSVDYYDYKTINAKEIPFKIFFKNYKYGYSINIEIKEIKK